MKNCIYFFLIGLLFTACKGDEGPQGPPGEDGLYKEVLTFNVDGVTNRWRLEYGDPVNRTNPYYVCVFNAPLLDDEIYEYGNVQGYRFINPGDTNNEVQTPLPYILPVENDNMTYAWLETVTFDFQQGSVAFYVTYDDFDTTYTPEEMWFRIVLTW